MTVKTIRVRKNRYTERCCARCGKLIGHLRLMASVGGDPWTCMPCEWKRREQLPKEAS